MSRNEGYIAEKIEIKIRRIETNKEKITDGAPLIYTDRKEGVVKAFNPRNDKWEDAIEATNVISMTKLAKREGYENVKDMQDKLAGNQPS